MYSKEDLHYAKLAAYIDGEGCLSLSKRTYKTKAGETKNYFYPNITVAMKHRKTIEHIFSLINLGEIYEHRGVHIWSVHNEEVKKVIEKVYPYLVTKKEQAKTILQYFENGANVEALYWKNRFEKVMSYK